MYYIHGQQQQHTHKNGFFFFHPFIPGDPDGSKKKVKPMIFRTLRHRKKKRGKSRDHEPYTICRCVC